MNEEFEGFSEPSNGGGGRVSYSTKELIARIDTKIDRFFEELKSKAEKVELTALETRVQLLENRILVAETRKGTETNVWLWVANIAIPSVISIGFWLWLHYH